MSEQLAKENDSNKSLRRDLDNARSSFGYRIVALEEDKFKLGSNIETLNEKIKQLQLNK